MRKVSVLPIVVALSACSSHDAPPTTTTNANEIVVSSGEYDLLPGDEKYICWASNLPADKDVLVRKISGEYGPGTHHVFFAWTLAPEPDGMSECPVLFKTTWIPIYLGGRNTSPLQMPDGAAIELGRGKQLVLQLHLQNPGVDPIKDHVSMHMELGEPGQSYVPAGIFGLDDRVISLPAGGQDVHSTMSCKPGKDMSVFSILGHMHKLGKELQLSKNGAPAYHEVWNFDEQPITPFTMTVAKDDTLGLDCTHANTRDHVVTYGESSDTEMCASILYYTPYDQLAGCINAPSAADAGASPNGGDGGVHVVGTGACTNAADLATVPLQKTSDALSSCGASCVGKAAGCTADCITQGSGLSSACGACYGASVDCTISSCLADCAAAPGGAACGACRATKCVPAFTTCSGLGD